MRLGAVDVDLAEQRKSDAVVDLAELVRYSSSRPLYCGVKPHLLAVFTMSSTLPA